MPGHKRMRAVRRLLPAVGLCLLAAGILLGADLHNRRAVEQQAAAADKQVYRLAIVYFAPEAGTEAALTGLMRGLTEQGLIEGQNLQITRRHAGAEMAMFPAILRELDEGGYDLIVTLTTPALSAAVRTLTKTPLVFTYVTDPLAAGAGRSFTDHLPAVTGVGTFDPIPETLRYIHAALPRARRVGVVYNAGDIASSVIVDHARREAPRHGLELVALTVSSTGEAPQALRALVARGIDVYWLTTDNTMVQAFDAAVPVMRDARIPIIANQAAYVSRGVLAAVGMGWEAVGHRTAVPVARVLRGESPAAIPIENFVVAALATNDTLAQRMGLTLPASIPTV